MTGTSVALCLGLALLFYVTEGVEVTFTNNCSYTVWPGGQSGGSYSQLSSTGFELSPGETNSWDLPSPWSGRFWARTGCSNNGRKLTCATADCGDGQDSCHSTSKAVPATLVEITLAANGGQDFYDISNVDGFNLPISIGPQGVSAPGTCKTASCAADVNAACPADLQLKGSNGTVIACKSACVAFKQDQYCCSGNYNSPATCHSTEHSKFFKQQCPDAYSYAYDDSTSTFTCSGSPDYAITFCPLLEQQPAKTIKIILQLAS